MIRTSSESSGELACTNAATAATNVRTTLSENRVRKRTLSSNQLDGRQLGQRKRSRSLDSTDPLGFAAESHEAVARRVITTTKSGKQYALFANQV